MGTLELLRQSAKRGPVVRQFDNEDAAFDAEIARQEREEERRRAYDKETLERLRNQHINRGITSTSTSAAAARIAGEWEASERQKNFYADLVRDLSGSSIPEFAEIGRKASEWADQMIAHYGFMPGRLVRTSLDRLIAHRNRMRAATVCPPGKAEVQVPKGRYALRGDDDIVRFYQVKISQKTHRPYVMQQLSDDLIPVRWNNGGHAVYAQIGEDVLGAARLYGQELGRCSVCGRTLTNEESRAYGVGPECRKGL